MIGRAYRRGDGRPYNLLQLDRPKRQARRVPSGAPTAVNDLDHDDSD